MVVLEKNEDVSTLHVFDGIQAERINLIGTHRSPIDNHAQAGAVRRCKKKIDGMLVGFGIPHGFLPNEWYLSELTNLTRPTSCMVTTLSPCNLVLLKTNPMNGSHPFNFSNKQYVLCRSIKHYV